MRLVSALSPAQQEQLCETEVFDVISNRGHRWTIKPTQTSGNLTLHADDDSWSATFCCHTRGSMYSTYWECAFAQLIWLTNDEDEVMRVGNVWHFVHGDPFGDTYKPIKERIRMAQG